MDLQQEITLKIFYRSEIRRVAIAKPSFESLVQFLSGLLQTQNFKITYFDTDGDQITIASEMEWQCALTEAAQNQLIKLHLVDAVKQEEKQHEQKQAEAASPFKGLEFLGFYSEKLDDLAHFSSNNLDRLRTSVPEMVKKYFADAREGLNHVPQWLSPAVRPIVGLGNHVDFDVDLNSLYVALNRRALELMDRKELHAAKAVLFDSLNIRPNDPTVWYNIGCVESLLNHTQNALLALKKAVQNGFSNFAHLEQDMDLANLRATEEFQKFWASNGFAKADENAAKQAEENAAKQAEENARKEAEEMERRRVEAEENARKEAEEMARKEVEEMARREAEEMARQQAEAQRRERAEQRKTKLEFLRLRWASQLSQLQVMGVEVGDKEVLLLDYVHGSLFEFMDLLTTHGAGFVDELVDY